MRTILLTLLTTVFSLTLNSQKWTNYTTASTSTSLCNNNVYAIATDAQSNIWIGTNDGLSKYDGSTWVTYTAPDYLGSNEVTSIAKDTDGNMWFGTYGGVSKYDGADWIIYTTTDGLV